MSLLELGMAFAKTQRGHTQRIWEVLAYAARYGKQPLSVVKQMPMSEVARFVGEVSKIVEEESKPPRGT